MQYPIVQEDFSYRHFHSCPQPNCFPNTIASFVARAQDKVLTHPCTPKINAIKPAYLTLPFHRIPLPPSQSFIPYTSLLRPRAAALAPGLALGRSRNPCTKLLTYSVSSGSITMPVISPAKPSANISAGKTDNIVTRCRATGVESCAAPSSELRES